MLIIIYTQCLILAFLSKVASMIVCLLVTFSFNTLICPKLLHFAPKRTWRQVEASFAVGIRMVHHVDQGTHSAVVGHLDMAETPSRDSHRSPFEQVYDLISRAQLHIYPGQSRLYHGKVLVEVFAKALLGLVKPSFIICSPLYELVVHCPKLVHQRSFRKIRSYRCCQI